MLLRFLCEWLDVDLLCLDVHGGTTEEDIVDIFCRASKLLTSSETQCQRRKTLYIFLDEINTCSHMVRPVYESGHIAFLINLLCRV